MKYKTLTIIALAIVFLIIFQCQGISQSVKTDTLATDTSGVKNTILPFLFFLPESGLAFGVTGISTFRLKGESIDSRPSQVIDSVAYTLKKPIEIQ